MPETRKEWGANEPLITRDSSSLAEVAHPVGMGAQWCAGPDMPFEGLAGRLFLFLLQALKW